MTWEICHQQPEGAVATNEQKLKKKTDLTILSKNKVLIGWYVMTVIVIESHDYPSHHHHHTPASTNVPKLCVSFSCCCKVRHITMETRGANGSSCRHDTPAQNSLLLHEETEEPFSISSSPHPSAEMCPHLMISVPVQTKTSSPHLPKWPLTSPKMPHPPVCAWNKGWSSHTQFLPHCASVQPPTGAGGEEALNHSLTELGRWGQAGVQRGTSPLSFSEAHQARGVLQVQDK